MMPDPIGPPGVVPIITTAGAALLPTILAAMATMVALLFKPRELWAAIRRRPHVPAILLALLLAGGAAWQFWPAASSPSETRRAGAATPAQIDWTRVALEVIRLEHQGAAAAPAPPAGAPPPGTFPPEPMLFRTDAARTGFGGGPIPEKLRPAWSLHPSYRDGSGALVEDREAMILSTPLVAGGVAYAASCTLDPPENYGTIFAVDLASGRLLWTFDKIDGQDLKGFFSSPALAPDGTLVIGQGLHPDTDCRLIALDARTGTLKWSVATELHIESSPAIGGGIVVAGCGAIEDPQTRRPKGDPGYVLAVDLATGDVLWREPLADPESSPVIHEGTAYIGSGFNGRAIAALHTAPDLPAGQARIKWKTDAPYPITGAVTRHAGRIFAGGGNGDFVFRDPRPAGVAMALDETTGEILWQTEMGDAVLGAMAARDDLLVVPVANGTVAALDPSTGAVLWRTVVHRGHPVLAAPALAGQRVYAVSRDGMMAVLDAADGRILESHYLNDPARPGPNGLCLSSPTVAEGRVVVGSETGGLRAFHP